MIFKIADGRECFYQWDLDRQLIVSDPTIKEVHFCNRTDVCSLVVEVVDGVANVPTSITQLSKSHSRVLASRSTYIRAQHRPPIV